MATQIISRAEARWAGLREYFTGKPCKRGHISKRTVSDGGCADCLSLRWRQWEKDNPARRREIGANWAKLNPDKISKKNAAYKKAHAKRLAPIAIERTKRWREQNPEKTRANGRKYRQTRRARILNVGGSYTNAEIADLLEKQKWKCANASCCASLLKSKELDHIIALVNGGPNDITNLQWLCVPCNRSKSAKDPITWAQENGRLL